MRHSCGRLAGRATSTTLVLLCVVELVTLCGWTECGGLGLVRTSVQVTEIMSQPYVVISRPIQRNKLPCTSDSGGTGHDAPPRPTPTCGMNDEHFLLRSSSPGEACKGVDDLDGHGGSYAGPSMRHENHTLSFSYVLSAVGYRGVAEQHETAQNCWRSRSTSATQCRGSSSRSHRSRRWLSRGWLDIGRGLGGIRLLVAILTILLPCNRSAGQ